MKWARHTACKGKINGRNSLVSDLNRKGIDVLADVGLDGRMSV